MTFNQKEYYKRWLERNREKNRITSKEYYHIHKKERSLYSKNKYRSRREFYRKWSWNKVVFLGKQVYVGFRQQKGYCSFRVSYLGMCMMARVRAHICIMFFMFQL